MVKNDMKPYVFKHPDYGTLRVLVVDGVPYYGDNITQMIPPVSLK